ncbi:hypothetical protein D3P07_21340 [Paenibacillus sp. 1011MAR3C5]|uniref:hypothetical protein n=1 Tax=Paenibacillus sp. 1011MAR3C5 TaxID=1675787 RepID=UPI000E6BA793|nr:hypothetical protein [Paenibacillus sp. 1011MAR3C5]RJE85118.1 hypothetical protein D3P07_21340 [Paenibacillus sp. 1011MAR3C5]
MKIKVLIVAALALIAAAVIGYSQSDGKPGALPDEQIMVNAINGMYNQGEVEQLVAVDLLDSRHAFVPFVSEYGEHGMSFWEWEKHEWRLTRVDDNGMPHIWKLDDKDPRKRVFVYHINPRDKMERLTFYLLRDRNAYGHYNDFFYVPRIQMELPVVLNEQNYGAIPFPEEWAQLMEADQKQSRAVNDLIGSMFSTQQRSMMYTGWIPDYWGGKTSSGRGYSKSGGEDVEFVPILNEAQLERTQEQPEK